MIGHGSIVRFNCAGSVAGLNRRFEDPTASKPSLSKRILQQPSMPFTRKTPLASVEISCASMEPKTRIVTPAIGSYVIAFVTVPVTVPGWATRSEEHTSELQSRPHLVCRLLLEKKKKCSENMSSFQGGVEEKNI